MQREGYIMKKLSRCSFATKGILITLISESYLLENEFTILHNVLSLHEYSSNLRN